MNTFITHLVDPNGEWASHIAARYGCTPADIWALNPELTPNYAILAPCVRVPAQPAPPPPPPLPPRVLTQDSSLTPEPSPSCAEDLVDVVHVTGEEHFHVLTQQESRALKGEIAIVRKLMDDYLQQMASAKAVSECQKEQRPAAQCTCVSCLQRKWALEAEAAGVLNVVDIEPAPKGRLSTDEDLDGQLATLNQARDWYRDYTPPMLSTASLESNWKTMRDQKILDIDKQIHALVGQIREQRIRGKGRQRSAMSATPTPTPTSDGEKQADDSATYANDATADLKHGKGRSSKTDIGRHNRSGITVVEVILFSDPSRRHYVPVRYRERVTWAQKVSTRVMVGKPLDRQLAGQLIKDIKAQLSESRKASPLGMLEFKLSEWTSKEDNLLNALHQEVTWAHNGEGATPYALNADAHAFRFAASASAGINNWNPSQGVVDIGVKGNAAFSMAEGSAKLQTFFPDQKGFVASMDYRNGEGQIVSHPIGVFRLEGKIELSCFAGARVQGEAALNVRYRPAEVTSGASALLGRPTLGVSRGASIGVKAGGFAGAQIGGTLSGSLNWIEPQTNENGERVLTKFEEGVSARTLVEIKAEGNAALGAGANGELGISIEDNRLMINCAGSVVLGPGAGGGFSTVVDLEQIGQVTNLMCTALAEVDYRYLLGVTQDAFDYICRALLRNAMGIPQGAAAIFGSTFTEMRRWWNARSATWDESDRLVRYLFAHRTDKIMMVEGQAIPFSRLPPQTLGPMLHLLIEGCPFSVTEHFEEMLVLLLSEITTWRQLIEVLEHTSAKGEKVTAMHTLEKINALLDGREQMEFNRFLDNLIVGRPSGYKKRQAWQVFHSANKRARLYAARSNELFNGLA